MAIPLYGLIMNKNIEHQQKENQVDVEATGAK